jgi:hypothetical protein
MCLFRFFFFKGNPLHCRTRAAGQKNGCSVSAMLRVTPDVLLVVGEVLFFLNLICIGYVTEDRLRSKTGGYW